MARGIYEIKLRERYVPALNEEDAIDVMVNTANLTAEEGIEVSLVVRDDHALKLFTLVATMYDAQRFSCDEIKSTVTALARSLGYYEDAEELADTVIRWVERLDGMTVTEIEEWLIG